MKFRIERPHGRSEWLPVPTGALIGQSRLSTAFHLAESRDGSCRDGDVIALKDSGRVYRYTAVRAGVFHTDVRTGAPDDWDSPDKPLSPLAGLACPCGSRELEATATKTTCGTCGKTWVRRNGAWHIAH
jgi:hypothetical protein